MPYLFLSVRIRYDDVIYLNCRRVHRLKYGGIPMNISIIGAGYVGLITGAGFARLGHKVICVDVIKDKVDMINRGEPPIFEDDLPELMKEVVPKRLTATTDAKDAILKTDITFIGVGTPPTESGKPNLGYLKQAAEDVGKALKEKDSYHIVVVKSTVPPGTTENIVGKIIAEHSGKDMDTDFGMVMSPEFLREGRALEDFFNPIRVVIGTHDEKAKKILHDLYEPFRARIVIITTEPKVAELIKYGSNAFLATKISFANEMGNLAKALGIDIYDVMEGVGVDPRIGRAFLNAGPGYGGSCLPKDLDALRTVAHDLGVNTHLLDGVKAVNNGQPLRMVELAEKKLGSLKDKTIGIMGVAFKIGTDDVRESQAIPIAQALLEKGAKIVAHDPEAAENMKRIFPQLPFLGSPEEVVANSDAILIITGWPEHTSPELYKNTVVIDGRHVVLESACKEYEGICW